MQPTGTQWSQMLLMWMCSGELGTKGFLKLWTSVFPKKNDFLQKKKKSGPLKYCSVELNSLFRAYKYTGSVKKFEQYKKQRNLITTANCQAKKSFLDQLHQADSKNLLWNGHVVITQFMCLRGRNVITQSSTNQIQTAELPQTSNFYVCKFTRPFSSSACEGLVWRLPDPLNTICCHKMKHLCSCRWFTHIMSNSPSLWA